ncbi:hypothetical protein N6H14_05490 [Paenibacillus sp. CC-CFT747]|nr:hypothetical protein N6H14_05490 [Paenibacillus sp. CC-CFT747]
MAKSRPIYVEIDIRGGMDRLWDYTQNPEKHREWDLRFTDIRYLPKEKEHEPQRFRYETRIGFGLRIRGDGEATAVVEGAGGERTSALRFGSEQALSLIREGAGYWKYIPLADPEGDIPIPAGSGRGLRRGVHREEREELRLRHLGQRKKPPEHEPMGIRLRVLSRGASPR